MKMGKAWCLCAEREAAANTFLASKGAGVSVFRQENATLLSVDSQAACESRNAEVILGVDTRRVIDVLHFGSAGAVCFARGLNDTPKIAALLLVAPGFTVQGIIVIVAMAMGLGGLLNARWVAETMSRKITPISHGQGLAANLATALLVIFASKFGMPVSTTHVSIGSLFGIGLTAGNANRSMIVLIVLSWLLTLPCAAMCAAGIYLLSTAV
jgi:PiT family inorganic phosphate transporter